MAKQREKEAEEKIEHNSALIDRLSSPLRRKRRQLQDKSETILDFLSPRPVHFIITARKIL